MTPTKRTTTIQFILDHEGGTSSSLILEGIHRHANTARTYQIDETNVWNKGIPYLDVTMTEHDIDRIPVPPMFDILKSLVQDDIFFRGVIWHPPTETDNVIEGRSFMSPIVYLSGKSFPVDRNFTPPDVDALGKVWNDLHQEPYDNIVFLSHPFGSGMTIYASSEVEQSRVDTRLALHRGAYSTWPSTVVQERDPDHVKVKVTFPKVTHEQKDAIRAFVGNMGVDCTFKVRPCWKETLDEGSEKEGMT